MKKKVVMMVVTMAMAAAMMTGCGAKGDTASQTTQESQTADASTMSGTLDEVKDFMFVVTDARELLMHSHLMVKNQQDWMMQRSVIK